MSHKSDASFFSNFHDQGYTKISKYRTLHFSSIFMTPAWYTKISKNWTLHFPPIFMTPGTQKLAKIGRFIFLQFS